MTRHTHRYIRIKIGKNKRVLFKCSLDGCVHTCREELVIGRKSICNRCSNEFIIDKLNSKLAKPHCHSCTISSKQERINKVAEMIGAIGK